tara:strand:- start:19438 stop:19725 length:288 start_codon:yes stop_codon:yes gene_type:complete
MQTIKKVFFNSRILPWLFINIFVFSFSVYSYAELEELDDKKLDEQTGKAGLTIDLSFKLSIAEIYIDYLDREQDRKQRSLITPPPPRIEYYQGKN